MTRRESTRRWATKALNKLRMSITQNLQVECADKPDHPTILGPSPGYIGTRLTYNLNFVVQLDKFKKRIVVLSDQYTTLVDKNLRADFATALSKMLQL